MGWWPFPSSSTTPVNDAPNENVVTPVKPAQVPENTPKPSSSERAITESTVKNDSEKGNPYRNLESRRDYGIMRSWQSYQATVRPIVWPHGISQWPAFGLSGLYLFTAAMPASILPGLPPRLARVIFSGAFATSGMAIRSGDEWNGASIATWWSASHVLLSSIYKTYRKEMAKKGVKVLTKSSPFAWALTTATIATGAAYGITL